VWFPIVGQKFILPVDGVRRYAREHKLEPGEPLNAAAFGRRRKSFATPLPSCHPGRCRRRSQTCPGTTAYHAASTLAIVSSSCLRVLFFDHSELLCKTIVHRKTLKMLRDNNP
jgi:hypothetical protein